MKKMSKIGKNKNKILKKWKTKNNNTGFKRSKRFKNIEKSALPPQDLVRKKKTW